MLTDDQIDVDRGPAPSPPSFPRRPVAPRPARPALAPATNDDSQPGNYTPQPPPPSLPRPPNPLPRLARVAQADEDDDDGVSDLDDGEIEPEIQRLLETGGIKKIEPDAEQAMQVVRGLETYDLQNSYQNERYTVFLSETLQQSYESLLDRDEYNKEAILTMTDVIMEGESIDAKVKPAGQIVPTDSVFALASSNERIKAYAIVLLSLVQPLFPVFADLCDYTNNAKFSDDLLEAAATISIELMQFFQAFREACAEEEGVDEREVALEAFYWALLDDVDGEKTFGFDARGGILRLALMLHTLMSERFAP